MASPAKKRRKNDFQASPKQVRGLDFFFGKQSANATQDSVAPSIPAKPTSDRDGADKANLTDEELARKLQREWDREAGTANGQPETTEGDNNESN